MTAYEVDMRGEATSGKQLRDDMITFLIVRGSTARSCRNMISWAFMSIPCASKRSVPDILSHSKPDAQLQP